MKNSQIAFTAKDETIDLLNAEMERSGLNRSQLLRRIINEHYGCKANIPESLLSAMSACKAASRIKDENTRLAVQKSLNEIFYHLGGGDHNENI